MIPEYEGLYMVSNIGRIKSLNYHRTGKDGILKPNKQVSGYLVVHLSKNGITKPYRISRLVAMAFIPNPDNLPEVNHKDEVKTNNCVENLEWCTCKYNTNYGSCIERRVANRNGSNAPKKVYQYNLNGEFVKEWKSMQEIEMVLGFNHSHICKCCKGQRKSAYGFIWKYKEPQAS